MLKDEKIVTYFFLISYQNPTVHAVQFLEDLGNKISNINDERRSKSFLFQSIGIAIQRGNASCVMRTTGSMGKLEELNYL
jgi:hypothetical protein